MPVSDALRRLLRVRGLEEEQQRFTLESFLAGLHELEHALSQAYARQRRGRERTILAADAADRVAAQVEMEFAGRHAVALVSRIAFAEGEAERMRREYLEKRVQRRQAETLISEAEAQDAVIAGRRAQQKLDDWYSVRARRVVSLRPETHRPRSKEH